MAVLQVKHGFVRLFGLAGKPVVIDEVHAYDTYMTGLLERLLEWLGALRSPVVLLSATLPTVRRKALMHAYLKGSRNEHRVHDDLPEAEYPRLTWIEGNALRAEGFAASTNRELTIDRMDDPSNRAVRDLLARELADGGCAVVICNTVNRAQEMYRELEDNPIPDTDIDLFHARFLVKDREQREKRSLQRFGAPTDPHVTRPGRFVLVATQVVEQSLDLDFDVMVTDIAPIDLLLQRSGRLHRHDRGDRGTPVLHIRWPTGDPPTFDRSATAVYDEHILLRTWHNLRARNTIAIPGDLQGLVDAVYTDSEDLPADVDGPLAEQWSKTWAAMREKQAGQASLANQPLIPAPDFDPEEFFEAFSVLLLEDRPVPTRVRVNRG